MKLRQKKQLLEQLKTVLDFRVDKYKTLFALLKGASTFKEIHIWMEYAKKKKRLLNKYKL